MTESVYVHIDTTSNAVLTKGLTISDFSNSIVHFPQNLLLLDPSAFAGEYESHTGLKVIRGTENIQLFFNSLRSRNSGVDLKWVDFTDLTMLKELTPLEISELLYFGHMKTHLHSPFFYKLQNNFVYFDLNDQLNRIYYRYIDEFYRIFANKLSTIVSEKINVKKSFFRKEIPVEKISVEILKKMRNLMQEGIIFSFEQDGLINDTYHIPIYIIEDYVWKLKGTRYREEKPVGMLIYHSAQRQWSLEGEAANFTYNTFV
ncbi:hypothetical protein A5844_002596 [Enterococcus sp. 10A9_DIV0425]|uniref:Uncharacterized protein n=1 Tax=Candidatus Enterococcus wittei TaxID=1987383 RepID=A0A242JWK4_9ENTE|nr:hypothetical protein [Enterococcus sp. 10A9_DIV0425]OTP06890.1 hypothetical protein A5844_002596 [Enterococcus sp. 10A9_DIV0425]THE15862.1 hypothetical protein E1H99_01715 [Enterococcus hirae]